MAICRRRGEARFTLRSGMPQSGRPRAGWPWMSGMFWRLPGSARGRGRPRPWVAGAFPSRPHPRGGETEAPDRPSRRQADRTRGRGGPPPAGPSRTNGQTARWGEAGLGGAAGALPQEVGGQSRSPRSPGIEVAGHRASACGFAHRPQGRDGLRAQGSDFTAFCPCGGQTTLGRKGPTALRRAYAGLISPAGSAGVPVLRRTKGPWPALRRRQASGAHALNDVRGCCPRQAPKAPARA